MHMTMTMDAVLDLEREEFQLEYGRWLRAVREVSGEPRRKLSAYLDCAESSIKNWEDGTHLPDVFTNLRIRNYFRSTLDARP